MLILASNSSARKAMLEKAGVQCQYQSPNFDEKVAKLELAASSPIHRAEALSAGKALSVSLRHPKDFIIGSDQTLEYDGRVFSKPTSVADARLQLTDLRGRAHKLHSAVALVHQNEVIWATCESATLTMRNFSEKFLNAYLEAEKSEILQCVGAYRFEGPGIQLFDHAEGSYHAILGMPLLPLLQKLREHGLIAS